MAQTVNGTLTGRPVSAAQQWVDAQPYNVIIAADNPSTPEHIMRDIVRYGTAEAKNLLCRNRGVSSDILESIVSNKVSMLTMRWIAENPNASSTTLGKVAFHNRDPITLLAILKHENLPLYLAEQYLPTSRDYNSGQWTFGEAGAAAARNKVVSFELLLKHINYYHDKEIDSIVKTRWLEFFELIKPYRPRKKDAALAMGKLINMTLFGTAEDVDVVSDWYGQLLVSTDGNSNAIEQLKKSAAKWL